MQQKYLSNTLINNKGYISYYELYIKNSNNPYKKELYSMYEFNKPLSISQKKNFYKMFFFINFSLVDYHFSDIILSRLFCLDLIHSNRVWRFIKGYPTLGQRTHSNSKNAKKNKLLNNYRLNQFFNLFGHKKRNIYPTLIIGEYTNRLWAYNWTHEWYEARLFLFRLIKPKTNKVPLDPSSLAKNFTNGYTRTGQASKLGKSKKITQVGTIGYPIFFSRWLYYDVAPKEFAYKIWISDTDRKKMGKKKKKKK